MTSSEKTPVLPFNKTLYTEDKQKKKCLTKLILGWIFIVVLIILLILLILEIFASSEQVIRFWPGKPIDVDRRRFQPTKKHKINIADPWNLDFLIDPSHLCATLNPPNSDEYANNPEVMFLVVVPSAVDHFEQRKAIRNSWGSLAKKPFGPMRLAFILGTTSNDTVDRLVKEESSEYRDIIQAGFEDSCHQLTTKSIVMLKWVAKRCPHAQFFLKAEDDTFVNLGNVARILSSEPYVSQEKFISGHIKTAAQPQRTPEEDFYISIVDYPGEEFPPYASGSAFMMPTPTAIQLFQACQQVKPLLPEEDVYLTGLCAQHIDATLIHEPTFVIKDPPTPPSWETFSPLAAVHSVSPDSMEFAWSDMTEKDVTSYQTMEIAINATVLLRLQKNQ